MNSTHHQSSSGHDLQMASGGGGALSVGTVNAAGHANLHLGDSNYYQPVIHQHLNTPDPGPHFWVDEYPTSDFTGREDCLGLMRKWLLVEDNRRPNERIRHKIVVLEGMGGCGKTQLALKFVHSVKPDYWGIFWVNASKEKIAQSAYGEIASRFGKGGKLGSFTAGKQWLASQTRPWLLVLDNADEVEEDLINIQRLIPPGNHGHVLITTRTPGLPDKFANSGRLHLRDMRPEEGIDLLLRCAYPEDISDMVSPDRGVAGEIVSKMLYNLAKPIDAAGHYIRERKYTLERYLAKYLPQQKQRERENRSRDPADIAVETTWEIPIGRIRKKASNKKTYAWRAHQDAIDLFHCFTFLHFTGIPRRVFHDVWRSQSPIATSDTMPDLLSSAPGKTDVLDNRLDEALKILRDYAIIENFNIGDSPEELERSCYTFHPLVQSSARHKLQHYGDEEQDLRPKLLLRTMHFLASALPIDSEDIDPKFARKLVPHVVDAMSMVSEIDLSQHKSHDPSAFEEITSVQQDISESLMFSGEGAALYERFLSIYDAIGWWSESLPLYRKAIAIRRHKCGLLAESTLQVERKFSCTCFLDVQLEDAIRTQLFLLMKRWRKRESWTNWIRNPFLPDHIPFYTALSDLSMSLWQAQKHSTSLKMGRIAAAGFKKHLEWTNIRKQTAPQSLTAQYLSARHSVGRTLFHTGNHKEAHEVLRDVVRECKRSLQLRHMQVADIGEEIPLWKKRPPGLDHFDTLFARSDLALNLAEDLKGRPEYYQHIVRSIMKNVMEGRERTLGEQHPYTLLGQMDYSKVLGVVGEPLEGIPVVNKVLCVAEETLKDHGIALELAYGSMARVYAYAYMWDEAADVLARLYQSVKAGSPQYPMVCAAYARLSFRAGRPYTAEQTLRLLLAYKAPSLERGFNDAATENVLEQLAVLYKHTGEYTKLATLKAQYPHVDENSPIGAMYGVFNRQFKEEDDKIRTLIDVVRFLFEDADKGRVGKAMYNFIIRYGDKKYGSEQERERSVKQIGQQLDKEGLTEKANDEMRRIRQRQYADEQARKEAGQIHGMDTSYEQTAGQTAEQTEQIEHTTDNKYSEQVNRSLIEPTQLQYERRATPKIPDDATGESQTPRVLPSTLLDDHTIIRSASQQSLVAII